MSATPLCDKLSELGHDLLNHISDPYQRERMLLEVEPLLAKLIVDAQANERARCLYWCDMGDKEGYATHHIREGTPSPEVQS